jgi:hypothetical protein
MNLTSALRSLTGDGLEGAISSLHHAEGDLAFALLELSRRHAADHEIHVVARDLASWSREHVRRLAEAGQAYGLDLEAESPTHDPLPTAALKWATGLASRRARSPSVLLLADLRGVHLAAAGVSVDWEILAQSAQASELGDLVELTAGCHPQTLRQLRWTNAQLKELAAQAILTS